MKSTKIDFRTKIVSTLLGLSAIIPLFFSCDVLEPDADVLKPAVSITEGQVFVLSNNSAFIDLNTKIKTTRPVRLSVTSSTKFGLLSDLGKGLLQYTPSVGKKKAHDAFEFTVFSENNEVIKVDTVTIIIENDSTNLPCGIFPADDYVYGAKKNIPFGIHVLSNDYICGTDSADLVVSIFRPDNTFPPYFGSAEVIGQTVFYTPGNTFEDFDKLMYKVHPQGDPGKAVYGMVYIAGEQPCDFVLKDDNFTFEADSLSGLLELPALQNDSLCQAINNYQINIAVPPKYGNANVAGQVITYQVADTITTGPSFSDFFLYEVCIDAHCKTAKIEVGVKKDSSDCQFGAVVDSIDLSGNAIPLMYLGVLHNDRVCEGYTSFTITQSPHYGTAEVSTAHEAIAYERDLLMNKNDSLEYEICNAEKCSRAKVYIKLEK